jgi:hypothetical protein
MLSKTDEVPNTAKGTTGMMLEAERRQGRAAGTA